MSSTSLPVTRDIHSVLQNANAAELSYGTWDGYRFDSCWMTNTVGEHWKVCTPNGVESLAHVVAAGEPESVQNAVSAIGALHHPNLCTYEIGPIYGGRILFTTPWRQHTTWDWFHHYWRSGSPGVPRSELLDHWRVIAETLDAVAKEHQLFHLWLNPRLLFLDSRGVQIAGLGLPDLFLRSAGIPLGNLNPRYGAPEVAKRRPVSRCDQYSLAVMYAELVTGVYPFRSPKDRLDNRPNLSLLASRERDVVQRAMQTDPRRRFPTCLDFVRELLNVQPMGSADPFKPVLVISERPGQNLDSTATDALMDHFVSELVAMAFGSHHHEVHNNIRYTLHLDHIEHHCIACLFPGAAPLKLDGFRRQWNASPIVEESNRVVFQINLAAPLWKRLLGRGARLEIDIEIVIAKPNNPRSDISVTLRPVGCSPGSAKQVLRERGLEVLESLRMFLQAQPDQRSEERASCIQSAQIRPVIGGVMIPEPIEVLIKDVSPHGIGFYLPKSCDTTSVYINLPNVSRIAHLAGLAEIVRKVPCHDGWYEVGASFDVK